MLSVILSVLRFEKLIKNHLKTELTKLFENLFHILQSENQKIIFIKNI